MLKGNAIVGQSGGPTSVINASLVGIIHGAKTFDGIEKVLGMRFAIEGFMAGEIIDLDKESSETIDNLKFTPSSALGTCRHKLQEPDLPICLEMLKKYNIRYMFLIGGNDTMDTICRLERYALQNNYDLVGLGVPKTVDNDLFGTDHTPGFPSAARYNAVSVMQAGLLARDMQKADPFVIFQTVGRDSGWLVAACAAGKRTPSDPPHILCMPERPFEKEKFLKDVKRFYDEIGWVSIACGEGICFADGTPVSRSATSDPFDNPNFGAKGGVSAALELHKMISQKFNLRGEFQIPESLPMCAADRAVQLDIDEAYRCGQAAVDLAKQGKGGLMVTLEREPGAEYQCTTGTIALEQVAVKAKPMPDEYINDQGNHITNACMDYLKPLIGDLPSYTNLSCNKMYSPQPT